MIDLNDLRHAMSRALTLGRYTVEVRPQNGQPVPASITLDLLERDDDLFGTEFSREADARAVRYPTVTPEGDELYPWMTDGEREAALKPEDSVATFSVGFSAKPSPIEALAPEGFGSDDHGAAIPAQGPVLKDDWTELDHMLKRMAALEERAGVKVGPSSVDEYIGGPRIYEFALQDAVAVHNPAPQALWEVYIGHAPDLQAASDADWVHVYDRVTRERRTLKRPEPDAVLTGLRDVAAELRGK